MGVSVTENTQVQTLMMELPLMAQYAGPATALRSLVSRALEAPEFNRWLAGRVSAIDTHYPPLPPVDGTDGADGGNSDGPEPDALVGRRMPDVDVTVEDSTATRVYELFAPGRFVLLDLTGEQGLCEDVEAGWGGRVDTAVVSECDARHELMGASEVLVRPDGRVAWVHRGADAPARRFGRARALTRWAGRPTEGSGAAGC
ncbi:hypothetical protein [Streptomyces sp. NPDC047315]|uniref:aromatic-ring hydroxylase C-terminal domain-containing protein n=1 Tax=Streptomyces sp. NPDC047315 TaxID=3155142 RepID=UPI003400293C